MTGCLFYINATGVYGDNRGQTLFSRRGVIACSISASCGALILQAKMPALKRGLATRQYTGLITETLSIGNSLQSLTIPYAGHNPVLVTNRYAVTASYYYSCIVYRSRASRLGMSSRDICLLPQVLENIRAITFLSS